MSFKHPKYLQKYKEQMRELWIMCYGKVSNKWKGKKGKYEKDIYDLEEELQLPPPNPKLTDFHTISFPKARSYLSYFREWKAKLPKRNDKAIKARMKKEIEERRHLM